MRTVSSICIVHNEYQHPGGEDEVVRAESALLRARGHGVHVHRVHNDRVNQMSRLALLRSTIWNTGSARTVGDILASTHSEIAHFHNTVPLISPSAYYAARRRGAAVVQTLHNYRLMCPGATLFRDGLVCEECVGKAMPWPGVVHACYRDSRAATGVVAAMLTFHRAIGTWSQMVDVYVALTEFARRKFIEGGLPEEKIVVKPNFVEDPGEGGHQTRNVLFVGRPAPEKGVETLLAAWRRFACGRPDVRLQIVGGGPASAEHRRAHPSVDWFGWQPRERALDLMKDARLLVFPSIYYEGFPVTLAEAMATGLPVIASHCGGVAKSCATAARDGCSSPTTQTICTGCCRRYSMTTRKSGGWAATRTRDLTKYTPEHNYEQLMEVVPTSRSNAPDPLLVPST